MKASSNQLLTALLTCALFVLFGCERDKDKDKNDSDPSGEPGEETDTNVATEAGNPDEESPKPCASPCFQLGSGEVAAVLVKKTGIKLLDDEPTMETTGDTVDVSIRPNDVSLILARINAEGKALPNAITLPKDTERAVLDEAGKKIYAYRFWNTHTPGTIDGEETTFVEGAQQLVEIDLAGDTTKPKDIAIGGCMPKEITVAYSGGLAFDSKRKRVLFVLSGSKPAGDDTYEWVDGLCSYDSASGKVALLKILKKDWNNLGRDVSESGFFETKVSGLYYSPSKDRLLGCSSTESPSGKSATCSGLVAFDPESMDRDEAGDVTFSQPVDMISSWFAGTLQIFEGAGDAGKFKMVNVQPSGFGEDSAISFYEFFTGDMASGKVTKVYSSLDEKRSENDVPTDKNQGDMVVLATYAGGEGSDPVEISIDEDVPNLKILVSSYESIALKIVGPHADKVSKVVVVSYETGSTVQGVDSDKISKFSFEAGDEEVNATFVDVQGSEIVVGPFKKDAQTTVLDAGDSSDGVTAFQMRAFAKVRLGGSKIRYLANLPYEGGSTSLSALRAKAP